MIPRRKRLLLHLLRPLAVISFIVAITIALWFNTKLQSLEYWALDRLTRRMPANESAANSYIVIALDEIDIRALNHYPITDEQLRLLIQQMLDWGAVTVGVDIARDVRVDPGHDGLAELFKSRAEIVCIRQMGKAAQAIRPPRVFSDDESAFTRVGFVDFPRDRDGIVRRGQWYIKPGDSDEVYCSLSLLLANRILESRGNLPKATDDDPAHFDFWLNHIPAYGSKTGGHTRAADGSGVFPLDYRGGRAASLFHLRQAWPSMPLDASTDSPQRNEPSLTRADVRGKAVLIGVDAASVKDQIDTPLAIGRPGVAVHGIALDNLLRVAIRNSTIITTFNRGAEIIWTIPWAMLGASLAMLYRRPIVYALTAFAAIALLVAIAYASLRWRMIWIPVIPPLLCLGGAAAMLTVWLAFLERRDKTVIRDIFSRTHQEGIAQELLNRYDELVAHGRLRPVETIATVMFTDLQGFTSLSENMKPSDLIQWLDDYWTQIGACVTQSNGTIVKFMGDGMLAVFGVPLYAKSESEHRQHALAAVCSALNMRRTFSAQRAHWQSTNQPCPRMRIGILTGKLIVGTIGGKSRMEFATLGDVVNTASRLESHNKEMMDEDVAAGGCRILMGESTHAYVQSTIKTRRIGEIQLAGKQQSISVFGVIDQEIPS